MPLPDNVYIPLSQHIGTPCHPCVAVGDIVKTGQIIATSDTPVSSTIHASVTGKIKQIAAYQHPFGGTAQMIHIERTGDDDWSLMPVTKPWHELSQADLRKRVQHAGIVGLGGAAFPTHVKLAPPPDKVIDAFILNGCECEPFLTADHRTMLEMADGVLAGMRIIMHILAVKRGYIAIEDNKPDAIAAMQAQVDSMGYNLAVISVASKYPQGAEKMLIEAVLHRKVPAGGLPMDVGVVVHNVGTALAVSDAVLQGRALVRRIVTVTGDGITGPANVLVRLGTPFKELLEFCGGLRKETVEIIMGGPMMGFSQFSLDVPVIKATSAIICSTASCLKAGVSYPCIRCGACIAVCPVNLLPTRLARYVEVGNWQAAVDWGIDNCMACGSCAFECPANIPLVQWLRVGKLQAQQPLKRSAA
jgi:electron transport complex protein RnfC